MTTKSRLIGTITRKLGFNKGAPRVWLEGVMPTRAGFTAGSRYSVSATNDDQRVILKIDEQGMRLVSAKTKGEKTFPVIDLNSKEVLGMFEGMNMVRIVILDGEIHILPDAVEVKKADRKRRLDQALEAGVVTVASVSHGVGVLTNAIHVGMKRAGLTTRLLWACEIREEVLEQAQIANDAWDADTIALAMPLQNLVFADQYTLNRLEHPVILEAGLPCTAASISGKSKKGLAMAEDDESAGHLIAAFIALIARVNPVVIVLENVVPYFRTASASILRTSLKELGYDVQEREIQGADYAIEARPRRVLVAVTSGIDFDFEAMTPPPRIVQKIGEILDSVPLDDPSWTTMQYLKDKEVRDREAGKGFAMTIVGPEDTRVNTLGTGYQKNRSTEAKLRHPENPNLLRLFTPREHAKLKGIPEKLISGLSSKTFCHELLGQSVIWPAFRQLGEYLGAAISKGIGIPVAGLVVDESVGESLPLFQVA